MTVGDRSATYDAESYTGLIQTHSDIYACPPRSGSDSSKPSAMPLPTQGTVSLNTCTGTMLAHARAK